MSAIIHKQDIDDNQPMTGDETDTEDVNFKYLSAPTSVINNKSDVESYSYNNIQHNLSLEATDEDLPSVNDANYDVDQIKDDILSDVVLKDSFSKENSCLLYNQFLSIKSVNQIIFLNGGK